MGSRLSGLLLFLLLLSPPLVAGGAAVPASSPPPVVSYSAVDRAACLACPIPPTIPDCGGDKNPHCRPPFSMPYKGQNGEATCARLRCPDNYDMFVNTAASGRDGGTIVDFTPRRVVLNPQTIICARYGNGHKFMIRDGQGFMRPVNDVQCRQNNFPRHSCVTDGFLKQTCRKNEKCVPISFLSDYAGNKCNAPYKLMMRFGDGVDWEPFKKLSCDRDFGWWRIHFPNGTWMHTRYGTIATCVDRTTDNDEYTSSQIWSLVIRGFLGLVVILATLFVSFNAYMCRSIVIWEGSNWQRIWQQELYEFTFFDQFRETTQAQIVKGLKSKWHKDYQHGLHLDMRQYEMMVNRETYDKTDHMRDMRHWTMVDDFDYIAQREEAVENNK